MPFTFSNRSETRLVGVNPDLVKIVRHALTISDLDFTVLEGKRTLARQKILLAQGATTTLNSRHITGHAIDLAPLIAGIVRWDWPLYHRLADIMKRAAKDVGIPLEWGGDWKTFKDGPHFQLPFSQYPVKA